MRVVGKRMDHVNGTIHVSHAKNAIVSWRLDLEH